MTQVAAVASVVAAPEGQARHGARRRSGAAAAHPLPSLAAAAADGRRSRRADRRRQNLSRHHGLRRDRLGVRGAPIRRDVAADRAACTRVRHRGFSRRDPRRVWRSDHRVLHRCAVVVGGVHALWPRDAARVPDLEARRNADGPRAPGRAGRGRVHLVVDHRHGGGGDAAAARSGSAARCGAAARAQQLWPGVDDCHCVWPAHRWHRHAGGNSGEPGRHQPAETARQRGRVVHTLDALRRSGIAVDGADRVAAVAVAVSAGTSSGCRSPHETSNTGWPPLAG